MQENKFENRVQEQMEGFRIRPSEAVWQKVEEELRKKKKRRVVFYFFLLAALSLLGYSGYFLFNSSKPDLVHQNISTQDNSETGSIKNNEILPPGGNSTAGKQKRKKENQPSVTEKNSEVSEKKNSNERRDIISDDKEKTSGKNFVDKIVPGKKNTEKSSKVQRGKTENKEDVEYDGVADIELVQRETRSSYKQQLPIATIDKIKIAEPRIAGKQLIDDKQIPITGNGLQVKNDSTAKETTPNKAEEITAKTKQKKSAPKINWGFELSGGISSSRENAFSIIDGGEQKNLSADFLSAPTASNAPGAVPNTFYLPSSIRSGPGFRAGIIAEMKISKKSSLSSGLRYAYFSNSIKVGAYKDTAVAFNNSFSQSLRVGAIYRGYHQEEYINRFHFIQIPLQYQLQLNKGVKVPILWNAGASAGYLISTNGLVYDTAASGIYYHDKDAFNKFHLNLNTGFSFRFGNKNKIQWSLGPELTLGMNKLTKNDYTRKQYLLYSGITGKIIFGKKK